VLLPRLAIWSVALWTLSFTTVDPDLWGHVRFGQDMLRTGQLTTEDPYSFSSDLAWVNHEWLAELIMGSAYTAYGAPGLVAIKLALLIAAFWILSRELRERGVPPLPRDLLLICAIVGCLSLTKTFRPQTFSLTLFAYLVWALRQAEDRHLRALIGVPLAMALWANLHGGWLLGGGILGGWVVLRAIWPLGASRNTWLLVGAGSLLATLATPEGPGLWRFLWNTVGFGRADITEWQSITALPRGAALFWLTITPVAIAGLWRMTPRSVTHIAVTLLLMVVSFKVARVVSFYAIATIMLCGPHLARPTAVVRRVRQPELGAVAIVGVMACAWLGSSAYFAARNAACIPVTGDWMVDLDAGRAIRAAALRGRMLTWFDWGEYVIWHRGPALLVSLDGRRETVYSERVLAQHRIIYDAADGWDEELRSLAPDHIWLPKFLPVTSQLEAQGWVPIHETSQSVLFSKAKLGTPVDAPEASPHCFPG
jgi:hypothetical protein